MAWSGLWLSLTACGLLGLLYGGFLAIETADVRLLRAQVKAMAKESHETKKLLSGIEALERDLQFLWRYPAPQEGANVFDRLARPHKQSDTMDELLRGKISKEFFESVLEENVRYQKMSQTLLNWGNNFLTEWANAQKKNTAKPSIWPARGMVSSGFGMRLSPWHAAAQDGREEEETMHRGIDIVNASGTPVLAASDGVVRRATWITGYGRTVVIDHGFGYSTLYGHTSEIRVAEGDYVKQGNIIAYMGTTGKATGNHLHFEIWRDGRSVDPFEVIREGHPSDAYAQSAQEAAGQTR